MSARTIVFLVCAATIAVSPFAPLAAGRGCIDRVYAGFDSRLEVDIVGKVPLSEPPVGFEVVGERPVVAFSHRLIAVDGRRLIVQPSLDAIRALTVDAAGTVRIQTKQSIKRFAAENLVTEGTVGGRGRIHNSGAPAFLVTNSSGDRTRLMLAGADAPPAAFDLDAPLRSASINLTGLAAVVGDALLAWKPGSTTIDPLAVDAGLRQALDVTLIEPGRAVVALPNLIVLVTERARVILGAVDARVRWAHGKLYVLDRRSGIIWTLNGLEGVGNPETDRDRARQLAVAAASPTAPEFLEAVRLAGCEAVEAAAVFKRPK